VDFITERYESVRRSVTERERQQPFFRDEVAVECGGAATALNHVFESQLALPQSKALRERTT
jgi:hypothetical protein